MAAVQGGNTASFGPFDQRSLITPQGITPPNFLAYISLIYPPYNPQNPAGPVPLSLNAPGMFLALTPATLNETVTTNGGNLSYTQNGAYLAGWQLLDNNGNPMAPGTVAQLFGTPSIDQKSHRPGGTDLTPVDPSQPFAAFNGGWYFDVKPVNDAAATWADAFFNWGLGTSSYSPRSLIPQGSLTGSLPNTATPDVSDADIGYKLTFQPPTDSPPPAPAFTSAASAIFTESLSCQFPVQATGVTRPVLSESRTDVLPKGITFNPRTGILSGTPAAGSADTYILHFIATNGVGSIVQTFTLNVYSQAVSEHFVQALYQAELGRSGSTAELLGWVNVLDNVLNGSGGQPAVVNGIANSLEAHLRVVRGWYQTYLGRPPSVKELNRDARALGSKTQEQVLKGIVGSSEFYSLAQGMGFGGTPDENYVRALYKVLLGRTASSTEVADQVAELQRVGQQQLALNFLQSPEYRTDVVKAYYTNLLHRPGSQAEVNGWVYSDLDLLRIRMGIENTADFFRHG
jgi:hypothetical protein